MSALVVVKGVVRGYRRRPVLKGVSLEVAAFESVGLVGENGSGKSTLLDVIAGARAAEQGTVEVKATLGYCPQSTSLPPRLTVDEVVALFGAASRVDDALAAAAPLLDRFALDEKRDHRVEQLSGGERQKLSLLVALLPAPRVVLLDEPYQGLDRKSYDAFWSLVEDQRQAGGAFLIVSHLILESERLTRVLTLDEGVIR